MKYLMLVAVTALAACNSAPQEESTVENAVVPAPQQPLAPPEPGTQGGLPDDGTTLEEPKGTIDPKSAEATGQVVQSYGALIEQKRFGEAERLWSDSTRAASASDELRGYPEVHLQVGKPHDPEGAAGSIYITVPTVLYGKERDGAEFNRSGEVILRRVNDVPGSTEQQRRWHIESAAWPKGN